MHITSGAVPSMGPPQQHPQPPGHAHFWERALSRRQVIKTAAGGAAIAVGSSLWMPSVAHAANRVPAAPRPIPEVIIPGTPFHVLSPGSEEPSTITDFNGFIAATELQGTGTGHHHGHSQNLLFDVDMRFMQGTYVGVDGKTYRDTFGFV